MLLSVIYDEGVCEDFCVLLCKMFIIEFFFGMCIVYNDKLLFEFESKYGCKFESVCEVSEFMELSFYYCGVNIVGCVV